MGFYPAGLATAAGIQPYQFQPESYGAVGNGVVCADVGTNGTLTVTSPTLAAKAVAGMYVMIHGANGATNGPYLGQIATVTGTGATLTAGNGTPSATVSNCPAVFGNDDTAAINSCITAASNYALGVTSGVGAGNFLCEVVFGAKIYILGTGPTQFGNGNTTVTVNTQVAFPYLSNIGNNQKLILKLTGVGAGYTQYWQAVTPQISGTALVSILPVQPSNSVNPALGQQSVVGGPAYGTTTINAGYPSNAGGPGFANVKAIVRGISIWLPALTNINAWDLGGLCQAYARESNAHAFAPPGINTVTVPVQPWLISLPGLAAFKSTISCGFIAPQFQNNADVVWDDCTSQGFECGFRVYDHFRANSLRAVYVDVAVNMDRIANLSHLVSISNMDAEVYNGGLQAGNNPGTSQVDIVWSAECVAVTYDVSDPNSALYGEFHFQDSADLGRGITVSGAPHLHVVTDEIGPGHVASPPAVPATTVSATQVWRDAAVTVHTGAGVTVSAITVDGTATGVTVAAASTAGPVRVPSGKTIALTYAGGTPTWDWWLD